MCRYFVGAGWVTGIVSCLLFE